MAEWSDSSFYLQGSAYYLFFLPALAVFAHWAYRHTYPQPESARRIILVALRTASFGLLVLILAEPIVGWWSKQVIRPVLLILLDTSPSMKTTEQEKTRLKQVVEVLGAENWQAHLGQAEIRSWGFADSIYPINLDTVAAARFGGRATNIAAALETAVESVGQRERVEGLILFSDGAHNLGRDPGQLAGELGVPVYALGVGGQVMPADVQLAEVRTVETGYVGQRQQINAELRSWGFEGRHAEIILYEGERELQRRSLVLADQGQVQNISFNITPQQAGPRIFRLVVTPMEGEFTRADNEVLVFTRILEERTRTLILAGGPSADLAFLYRSLAADSNIVVETLIQRDVDALYGSSWSPKVLQDRDVVFLVHPGAWLLNGPPAEDLVRQVRAGTGLVFIGGAKTTKNWRAKSPLAELLPFELAASSPFVAGEIMLKISSEGRRHPIVRLQADEGDPWVRLPPLPGYFRTVGARPGATVLVTGEVEGEETDRIPILSTGTYGQGKVIAALATAFWRLELTSSGFDGQPKTIKRFWRNATKWLAFDAPNGRIRASTARHVYRAGEEVVFSAQVFDELLRPQRGAFVEIALAEGGSLELQEQGAGHYRGLLDGLAPGAYQYKASAEVDGLEVGVDTGRFVIEEYSIEFSDLRADLLLLNQLARASGGSADLLIAWEEVLKGLSPRKKLVEKAQTQALWGPIWPGLLAVMLLAMEWFLRKRSGMV